MNLLNIVLLTTVVWAQSPPAQAPPAQNSQSAPGTPIPQSAPAATPLSVPGAADQPVAKNEPEIVQRDTRATFSTGTNLVMVPVIVRDHNGKPIGDLKQEDFQLFDRGKSQVITRFSMERAAEKKAAATKKAAELQAAEAANEESKPDPAAFPTRFIAYLFDDVDLSIGDLMQARTAAEKYFQSALEPGDRAAIFTTSGTVALEFTDDREQIHEALTKLRPQTRTIQISGECPTMTYYEANLVLRNDPTAMQVAISDAMQCMPPPPNAQAAQQIAQQMAQATATRILSLGEANTQLVLATALNLVNRMTTTPGQRLIVIVSPGFLITDNYRFDESQLLDKAVHSNVVISAIDARGLYTIIPGGDASINGRTNPATAGIKVMFQTSEALAVGDTLAELADGTGGTWFHNNNDLVEGLKHTADFPEYEYILGFSPQNLKYDGSFHKLKVTVKVKSDLQARRGYYAPRHAPNEAEQARQEIHEAMFSRDELLDIPLGLQTQFYKTEDGIKLAVVARIDLKAMKFQPKEGRQCDTVTIVTGLFDRNGQIIDSMQKTVDMRLKPENFPKYLEAGLLEKTSFDVHPGKYVLRVVVRDAEGQGMAARNGVVDISER